MHKIAIRVSVVAMLALGMGTARADDDTNGPAASSANGPGSQGENESGNDGRVEDVPDRMKAARSTQALSRMKSVLNSVLQHLTEARKERDVVKLNCVNEKLTAIKGLLKISEQADVTLREAVARGDTEVSNHEFEKVVIAQRKCEQLLAESEACVGELAVYAGDTDVDIEDDNEDLEDPIETPTEQVLKSIPAVASPFQ